MRFRLWLLGACLASASLTYAQSTLHIGFGAGTPCAEGCAGDPNVLGIPSSVVDIYQTSGGAKPTANPLLILAIPNNTTNLNFTIASETDINPYPAGTSVNGSAALTTFRSGFDSGDIYSFLGIAGNKSNSFGNLQLAESSYAGMSGVLSFGIYEFTLNTALSGKGLANVTFSAPLPKGTFAFGYAGGYDTPLTDSGLVSASPVPEPTSGLLLATSALAVAIAARRRSARRL